jgi:hypothetical protein
VGYTLLKVTAEGVALYHHHVRRHVLHEDAPALAQFAEFVYGAAPGVWAVWSYPGGVRAEPRGGTRLRENMPVRYQVSPIAHRIGPMAKPPSPCCYDLVRAAEVATLLTSPDGSEIYEACSAAVLGWNGTRLVCAPRDRPRVWSTAEAAIGEHLAVREQPILVRGMPLVLVNAVKGTCSIAGPERPEFPAGVRHEMDALFAALTARSTHSGSCCSAPSSPGGRGA